MRQRILCISGVLKSRHALVVALSLRLALTPESAPARTFDPLLQRKLGAPTVENTPKGTFLFVKNFPQANPVNATSSISIKKIKNFSFFCLTKKQKYTVLVVIMKNTAIQSKTTSAHESGRLEKIFAKAYCCSARMRKAADCKILL